MAFEVNPVMPGVFHIRDAMGVCMTLLEGETAALLVDTGYGVEDVNTFIRSMIGDKPLTVLLTHHHHDHSLGIRWFCGESTESFMREEDAPAYEVYNGSAKRRQVLRQAIGKGLIDDDEAGEQSFLAGECFLPDTNVPERIDLGGMSATIIPCPGHTPGSVCVLVEERKLLLTGDDWNPCTWVFFPEALGVQEFRRNVRALQAFPFKQVLCSHQIDLYPRSKFDSFFDNLTDDVLRAAQPVSIGGYEHIDTRQANVTDGQILVFDWNKAQLE